MLLPGTFGGFTGTVADTLQPSIPTAPEARANAEQPLEHLLQGEITPEQWGLDEALARQAGDLNEVAGGPGADYTISGKQATGEALEDGAAALREGAEGAEKAGQYTQSIRWGVQDVKARPAGVSLAREYNRIISERMLVS